MRVGSGFDAHRWTARRPLVLGGVLIPDSPGLEGHSDADVLTHAVIDALLGAAGLGDIGRHFPPGDARYRDASSIDLLREAAGLVRDAGWRVGNVDATVIAERPRLAPWSAGMRGRLAEALAVAPEQVSIKATTTDGMGFAGRGEGMAALAVALLERVSV